VQLEVRYDLEPDKERVRTISVAIIFFDTLFGFAQKYLGWNTAKLGRAKSTASKKVEFTMAQELILTKRNALDFDFYAHADSMAESISKQFTKR